MEHKTSDVVITVWWHSNKLILATQTIKYVVFTIITVLDVMG